MKSRNTSIVFAILFILAGGVLLSLTLGATQDYDPQIFWLLRMPRTITAIAVGGSLAVAGALIQASMGNPLAEPYTIGIASAAALGAVVGKAIPHHPLASSGIFAFVFAIGSISLLAAWLRRGFRAPTDILLAGVVLGFFCTSLATLLMAMMDPATWSSAMLWILGSLDRLTLSEATATLACLTILSVVGWIHWKPLDLTSIDDTTAESAGVDITSLRRRMFFIVALLTAVSVAVAGVIGFVGLIVPHVLRRLGLRHHITLIPVSFLLGAGLLLCSDVVARLVVRPSELPVGVVMAIIGAPFFLWIIRGRGAAA
jgi:iron complex transport system permease protein